MELFQLARLKAIFLFSGLEAYLKSSLLSNIMRRQPDSAYQQTIETCKFVVAYFGYYVMEEQQQGHYQNTSGYGHSNY